MGLKWFVKDVPFGELLDGEIGIRDWEPFAYDATTEMVLCKREIQVEDDEPKSSAHASE